eukprot:15347408-Alexandrium_andersonii.AAC.1
MPVYYVEVEPKTPRQESYDKLPPKPKPFKNKLSRADIKNMQDINALNLEHPGPSPATPAPSVPGRVQPPASPSQEEQRGKTSFKGDDSNSQSTSGK